jgi:hypothetical protein
VLNRETPRSLCLVPPLMSFWSCASQPHHSLSPVARCTLRQLVTSNITKRRRCACCDLIGHKMRGCVTEIFVRRTGTQFISTSADLDLVQFSEICEPVPRKEPAHPIVVWYFTQSRCRMYNATARHVKYHGDAALVVISLVTK